LKTSCEGAALTTTACMGGQINLPIKQRLLTRGLWTVNPMIGLCAARTIHRYMRIAGSLAITEAFLGISQEGG